MIGKMALTFFLALSLFSSPTSVLAATDKEDLLVGMKLLPLLSNKITDTVTFAIVFDPANASSKREAEGIKAILDSGMTISGDIKIIPVLVPASALDKLAGSKVAILAGGMGKYYDDVNKIAISNSILTMSTDLACVQGGKCIIGIVSKPRVEVYYNKSAAEAAKVTFSQVFSLLVKQI
jgi:hypothetical protein